MTKKDYYGFSFLLVIAIVGLWLGGYFGGIITGSCAATAMLIYFGKKSAKKAANQLEKYIRDHQLYNT
jgi:hypothetical protein